MSYKPTPGTIPHRVIEHLKTLPPGTELSTGVLADFVGQPKASMAACLNAPRSHGALRSRKHPEGYMLWSLGDGVPLPRPEDYDPNLEAKQVVVPAPSLFEERKPRPLEPRQAAPEAPAPAPTPSPTPAPSAPKAEPARAKFGIYSDGTFCVQRGQDAIWLNTSETADLMRFLGARS